MLASSSGWPTAMAQSSPPACTEVIGFSQTSQWYWGGFIQAVPTPSNWQLRWKDGASIDFWADQTYDGWNDYYLSSRCGESLSPERVILNVSGDYNSDLLFWADKTINAIANVARKYPSVRTIALQSVVGGPNGVLCIASGGDVVRATYNYPYINQALRLLIVGDTISLGVSPEVGDCSDYRDNIGHLTTSGAQAAGVSVARFWSGATANTPTPTPTPQPSLTASSTPTSTPTQLAATTTSTPTPTPTPTPIPTPAPTSTVPPGLTPTPTSTPTQSSTSQVTVTFDDLPRPYRPLSGEYPPGLIDWGTTNWYLSGPYYRFASNSISFNGAGPNSASFTLLSPRVFLQLDIHNGRTAPTTVTVACAGQSTVSFALAAGDIGRFATGWTTPCSGAVTLTSSNGWDTNFKNLVVQ